MQIPEMFINSIQTVWWSYQASISNPARIDRMPSGKKMTCSLLSYIKQCNTIFFMLPTWELELRCLMNRKDFKCSWIIKPSERWRGEQSGRCARLTDQEDLPVLSARRNKTSQNPQRSKLGMSTQTSFSTVYCTRERHAARDMINS